MIPCSQLPTRQDHALPLMVNNMWERDTLFLLFEEDFRITPTDIEPPVSHKPAALIEVVGDNSTFLSSADAENQGGKQARPGVPGKGRWYEMPTKETDHDSFATPNLVLNDVVRYETLAHRAGCSDLTWMWWQPGGAGSHPKRISSPASGSMFIMLSVPGAEVLTGAMDGGVFPMGHFDVKLLDLVAGFAALFATLQLPSATDGQLRGSSVRLRAGLRRGGLGSPFMLAGEVVLPRNTDQRGCARPREMALCFHQQRRTGLAFQAAEP